MTKFRSIFLAVTIFILNSCTFLSYNELPSLLSSAIFGSKEIEVDKNFMIMLITLSSILD